MKEQEIIDRIYKVKSLAGMPVNAICISNLDKKFYESLRSDKTVAKIILQHLKLGNENITQILNQSK